MQDSHFWGSGWSFPPTFEAGNRKLNLTHGVENINQSIDLILQTSRGERSVYHNFGSDLRSYIFGTKDSTLKGEMIRSVKDTLLEFEPRIDVDEVEVTFDENSPELVNIFIKYSIKETNTRHNHVHPFSINEWTI